MTAFGDKFAAVASKLAGFNGQAVTRHPGDGTANVSLTAFAFVPVRVERRFDENGGERFVQVASLRFARGTVVLDNDTWTIGAETDWATVRVVLKEPSVRVFIELPTSRTVGGSDLKDYRVL